MHNEEGKLFDTVFHKLLSLGVAFIAVAAVVWFVWAIARMSAITRDAPQPEAPAEAVHETPGGTASADAMIELIMHPMASFAARTTERLDRFPHALVGATADAFFFAGGPS